MEQFDEMGLLDEPTSDEIFNVDRNQDEHPAEKDPFDNPWLLSLLNLDQQIGSPQILVVCEDPTPRSDISQNSESELIVESEVEPEKPQNLQTNQAYKRQTKLLPNALQPIFRNCYKAASKKKPTSKEEAEQIKSAGQLFKGSKRNIEKLKLILSHKWFSQRVKEDNYHLFEVAFKKKLDANKTTEAIRISLMKFKEKIFELINDPEHFNGFIDRKKTGVKIVKDGRPSETQQLFTDM